MSYHKVIFDHRSKKYLWAIVKARARRCASRRANPAGAISLFIYSSQVRPRISTVKQRYGAGHNEIRMQSVYFLRPIWWLCYDAVVRSLNPTAHAQADRGLVNIIHERSLAYASRPPSFPTHSTLILDFQFRAVKGGGGGGNV